MKWLGFWRFGFSGRICCDFLCDRSVNHLFQTVIVSFHLSFLLFCLCPSSLFLHLILPSLSMSFLAFASTKSQTEKSHIFSVWILGEQVLQLMLWENQNLVTFPGMLALTLLKYKFDTVNIVSKPRDRCSVSRWIMFFFSLSLIIH